jgi:hypothetical protein
MTLDHGIGVRIPASQQAKLVTIIIMVTVFISRNETVPMICRDVAAILKRILGLMKLQNAVNLSAGEKGYIREKTFLSCIEDET